MRLLIVEHEIAAADALRGALSEEGFAVDVAHDAAAAKQRIDTRSYDAILLDVALANGSACRLCQGWRERGMATPILLLATRDDVADRVRGLECGGDDYLEKPFVLADVVGRVRTLLRRPQSPVAGSELRVGDLHIDTAKRKVRRGERRIALSTREYQLLEFLARHAGQVVDRATLREHVWERGADLGSNVVDVYVRYLRNKLGRDPDLVRTVRGGGYLLDASVATVADPEDDADRDRPRTHAGQKS